jgi:GTP-binding protein
VVGFVDEAIIEVSSGDGGRGAVSFRREKYVPRGGPDGGDGGCGGDVIFEVKQNLKTLFHLKRQRTFRAKNGSPGLGAQRNGKKGEDVCINVPPGTLIKNPQTGEILEDLKEADQRWVFLKGGRGGKGNKHFATSTRQAPKFAQPGESGSTRRLLAELNLIADVGLVGLPNAGKSTLLSVLTNAHPEIASYPFTTKIPNLGVLQHHEREIVIADIPGIIDGASSGAGLGIRFLKHISRTRLLLFLIDLTDPGYATAFPLLLAELRCFSSELAGKNRIIIGTKIDVVDAREHLTEFACELRPETVLGISAVAGTGLLQLKNRILMEVQKLE